MEVSKVKVLRGPGGVAIVPVHYSMDPDKGHEYVAKMRGRGNIDDWEKEMEINFESVEGTRCFNNFSIVANTDDSVEYSKQLPLRLGCDFGVQPMAWEIAQIQANEELHYIDEIYIREDASTQEAVEIFLDRYGDHYGELFVYGDASGGNRTTTNIMSNYKIMMDMFRGRPFTARKRVPSRNPSNVNNVNAFNRRLRDEYGNPRIKIHPTKCLELIRDLTQVVWEPEGKHIKKVRSKPEDPYFWRTHAVDAAMSIVYRHWPVRVGDDRKSEEEKKREKELSDRKARNKRKRLIGQFPTPGDRHARY